MTQRALNTRLSFWAYFLFTLQAFSQTPDIGYQAVISGNGLAAPIDIVNAGDGTNRLFVVQRSGTIRVYDDNLAYIQDFLTVSDVGTAGEGGLLSLAFHPDYATNGFLFVYYTRPDFSLEVARYTVNSGNGNGANPASKQIVINIPHPGEDNHNGGKILFGPDGYLYLATGDGGGGGDPSNNAQNGNSLLGKMLRINVNTLPYTLPPDNPYVADANVRDEIWALGLRNPFRWSFDRANGDMWIADVGQGAQEEINYVPGPNTGSVNYGWRCYEGSLPYNTSGCLPQSSYVSPIYTYGRDNTTGGQSVTGGFVYRGSEFSSLTGYYIFADFLSGNQWVITPDRTQMLQLPDAGFPTGIVAFGEAENGTLYAASLSGNAIYKVLDNAALPVTFGTIKATRRKANLYINWTTEAENNNSHFDIEGSVDGKTFAAIKTVETKAIDGYSSSTINYELTIGRDNLGMMLGISLLAVLTFGGFRSAKKREQASLIVLAILIIVSACNKSDVAKDPEDETLFIRIAQVDKDGAKRYSQTVQVVNEK
ncbi:PQQ-dependent sugar dehydrogenase [Niabella yanshanensis]|uniref:PQQ-dependent sugar dehydrogenase n=1 Tax=Niabella yanshanensis TaxID=577386 RepID=A0ABZ0W3E1_9BACT|nr:PQQ-dependent sugar dehydrogenase [Niabella yanshanensis]WQD36611.1 PQQ-dependent sugar dehydrogenase [Niabella yanshanensis]